VTVVLVAGWDRRYVPVALLYAGCWLRLRTRTSATSCWCCGTRAVGRKRRGSWRRGIATSRLLKAAGAEEIPAQLGTKLALSRHQVDILKKCRKQTGLVDLMAIIGRADRTKFRHQVFAPPLLGEGLIEMTIPDKSRSSNQEYRLTATRVPSSPPAPESVPATNGSTAGHVSVAVDGPLGARYPRWIEDRLARGQASGWRGRR
jgi:hypothetical protein